MKPIDRIIKKEVPGYCYIAKGEARAVSAGRESKTQRQRKPRTLTETAPSGKAVLPGGAPVRYHRVNAEYLELLTFWKPEQ